MKKSSFWDYMTMKTQTAGLRALSVAVVIFASLMGVTPASIADGENVQSNGLNNVASSDELTPTYPYFGNIYTTIGTGYMVWYNAEEDKLIYFAPNPKRFKSEAECVAHEGYGLRDLFLAANKKNPNVRGLAPDSYAWTCYYMPEVEEKIMESLTEEDVI